MATKAQTAIVLTGCSLVLAMCYGSAVIRSTSEINSPAPRNVDLNASIRFTGSHFVITNGDQFGWRNLEMHVNGVMGGYELEREITIAPGSTYRVAAMEFTKRDGTRFDPFTTKPMEFCIYADVPSGEGKYCGEW